MTSLNNVILIINEVVICKLKERNVLKIKLIMKLLLLRRILDYMDDVPRLENPRERGKMLIGNMLGLWRYRVGDYRILCKIRDEELIITVVEVGHRREVYD